MTNETTASQPTPHQNTLDAVTGAIAYGRQGTNPPPSPDHWLAEYWGIGQQLAELGKTSAWDNVTPIASQPKSIGDDAQFHDLFNAALQEHFVGRGESVDFKRFVAYIDNRAPAAQDSATIQAAPDTNELHFNAQRLRNVAALVGVPADGDDAHVDGVRGALLGLIATKLRLAAAIQEPVMVAEPMSRRQVFGICDAYESGMGHGLQQDGHKDGSIWGDKNCAVAYEIGYEKGDEALRDSNKRQGAAPMVADPAGVVRQALIDLRALHIGTLSTPTHFNAYLDIIDKALAATVKAVPSDAVDDERAYEQSAYRHFMTFEHFKAFRAECRAATLADKTGGGE